jgi:hypothetical protein
VADNILPRLYCSHYLSLYLVDYPISQINLIYQMKEVFIVSTARTPIGALNGVLSGVPATQLGATVIKAALERAGIAATEE